MQGLYTTKAVNNLINKYLDGDNDTQVYTINGSLLDSYIIVSKKFKTAIIKEVYLNEWSSAYKVTFYNKTPLKYERILDLLADGDDEKASRLFYQ